MQYKPSTRKSNTLSFDVLQKLKDITMKLQATKIVQAYMHYEILPQEKKWKIQSAYAEYYQRCRESDAGKNYYTQVEAWKNNDMATVQGCAEYARDLRIKSDYMPKPAIFPYDPDEMYWSPVIRAWKQNNEKLEQLENQNIDNGYVDL